MVGSATAEAVPTAHSSVGVEVKLPPSAAPQLPLITSLVEVQFGAVPLHCLLQLQEKTFVEVFVDTAEGDPVLHKSAVGAKQLEVPCDTPQTPFISANFVAVQLALFTDAGQLDALIPLHDQDQVEPSNEAVVALPAPQVALISVEHTVCPFDPPQLPSVPEL